MHSRTTPKASEPDSASHLLSWRRGDFAERGLRCLWINDERMIPSSAAHHRETAKELHRDRKDDSAEAVPSSEIRRPE